MTTGPRATGGKLLSRLRVFAQEVRGAAAAEFVLWTALLVVPVLSAVDIGIYVDRRMQLEIAAQAAVQAAWHSCTTASSLPAVQNCSGLSATMLQAAQGTSLGSSVTLTNGTASEGYYCVDANNKLVLVGTAGNFTTPPVKPVPFTCASVKTGSTTAPGDYIFATASYDYTPVFSNVSIASLLTTPITRTAWMRLN